MALPSTGVWEVRTTGAADNGGGFNAARGGVDRSQQDNPALIWDGASSYLTTSGAGSTTLTSAGSPSLIFRSNQVGNYIYISGGTNFTTGFYEIVSYTSFSQVVLDRSPTPSGAGTAGAGKLGGAQSGLQVVTNAMVAGNRTWIKGGTYDFTSATWSIPEGVGTTTNHLYFTGYDTTRGDALLAPAVIDAGGASHHVVQVGVTSSAYGHVHLEHLGFTNCYGSYDGVVLACRSNSCQYCYVYEVGRNGYNAGGIYNNKFHGCETYNYGRNTSGYGFYTYIMCVITHCYAWANPRYSAIGGYYTTYSTVLANCISQGSYYGFLVQAPSDAYSTLLLNCIAYDTYNTGFRSYGSGTGDIYYINCIAALCSGYDYEDAHTTSGTDHFLKFAHDSYNSMGMYSAGTTLNNMEGTNQIITLNSDPFVDGANGDFRIKPDQVQLLRTGFPTHYGSAGSVITSIPGTMDIGAIQRQRTPRRV